MVIILMVIMTTINIYIRVEGVNGHISTDEMEKLHVELHLKLLSEKKKTFYADVDV